MTSSRSIRQWNLRQSWLDSNQQSHPTRSPSRWLKAKGISVGEKQQHKQDQQLGKVHKLYIFVQTYWWPTQQKSNPVLVPHIPTPLQVLAFEIQWDTVLGSAPMATSTQGNPWQAWPWQVWQYRMQQQQRRRQQHMVPMSSSSDTPRKLRQPTWANAPTRACSIYLILAKRI